MIDKLFARRLRAKYKAASVNDAITCVGKLLEQDGLAETRYTGAMIKQLETHGAYMVVCPGVALVHSRPEDGAKDLGMALITLADPIAFGNPSNDPVEVVIGFSATTSDKHLKMIQLLAGLLSESSFVSKLTEAENASELYEVLNSFSKNFSEGEGEDLIG